MKNLGLYIHIPFCEQKCAYCDFCSNPSWLEKQGEYIEKMKQELMEYKLLFDEICFDTIFIGGGTPSTLGNGMIKKIIDLIKENFKISKTCEITIEVNPHSFTENKLKEYIDAKINRISMGIQTLNDDLLKLINRKQTKEDCITALNLLNKYNFKNFNVDIMLGLPSQTKDDALNDLHVLLKYNPTHISVYSLILEENTPLFKNKNQFDFALDEYVVDVYDEIHNELTKIQYNRYEISNYCLEGFECKHNLNYWETGEYIGVGLSAHSHINNIRYANTKVFDDYLTCSTFEEIRESETLTKLEQLNEFIMLSLRTQKGINIIKFKKKFKKNLLKDKKAEIQILLKNKFINLKGGHLKIDEKCFYLSNPIITKLMYD